MINCLGLFKRINIKNALRYTRLFIYCDATTGNVQRRIKILDKKYIYHSEYRSMGS